MLSISDLQVHYATEHGLVEAVKSISLDIREGEFCTFLGPSGCGKTTTLRCIAGLEEPTRGRIALGGQDIFNEAVGVNVPTHKRDLGMVFQSYAIWPHMTVFENVAFPLETAGVPRAQRQEQVLSALSMVGLGDFAQRSATQLSGGQQQRVALARAIVRNGKVLLLDEPLSNLDAKLREQMRDELRDLQRTLKTTTIFVTHDQDEALAMSDRIVVMEKGRIVEQGTPTDLYLRPRRHFTAQFIGKAEVFACAAVQADGDFVAADTPLGRIRASDPHGLGASAGYLMIRPESVEILPESAQGENLVPAVVTHKVFVGDRTHYSFVSGQNPLTAVASAYLDLPVGRSVKLSLHPERCVLLEHDSERAA